MSVAEIAPKADVQQSNKFQLTQSIAWAAGMLLEDKLLDVLSASRAWRGHD